MRIYLKLTFFKTPSIKWCKVEREGRTETQWTDVKRFKKICSQLQLYTFTTSCYFKPSFQCYAELQSFSASLELVLPAKYVRSDPFLLTTLFGIVWVGCGGKRRWPPHLNLKIAKRIVRIQLFDVHNTSNIFISKLGTSPWFKKRAVDVIRTVLSFFSSFFSFLSFCCCCCWFCFHCYLPLHGL